jgi:hypothetical protein
MTIKIKFSLETFGQVELELDSMNQFESVRQALDLDWHIEFTKKVAQERHEQTQLETTQKKKKLGIKKHNFDDFVDAYMIYTKSPKTKRSQCEIAERLLIYNKDPDDEGNKLKLLSDDPEDLSRCFIWLMESNVEIQPHLINLMSEITQVKQFDFMKEEVPSIKSTQVYQYLDNECDEINMTLFGDCFKGKEPYPDKLLEEATKLRVWQELGLSCSNEETWEGMEIYADEMREKYHSDLTDFSEKWWATTWYRKYRREK